MKKLCLVCVIGLLSFAAQAQKQALFITATALQAGDNPVSNRLVSLGFTVTRLDAPASVTADANGKDLIVISSSVTSGDVATKFTASPVPVINGEPALFDELGMDASNAGGTSVTGTNLTIVNCVHPMAAGFPAGPVTVITASGPLQILATPVAGAQIVATDPSGGAALFGFEKGAPMLPARIATAPARRVGIFWEATTFMTADGLKLFDAAVAWATGAPVPTNAPIGITSQPANLTINASTLGTFSVGFTGAAPYSVQWQRSNGAGGFTNIPGATCAAYATAENGVVLRAVVTNSFNSVTSSVATLHVKQALFITAAALATGDNAVSNRLASLGFAVTRVDAIASVTADANGKDLIVVSSSVASGDVATKFTASPVPLIDAESAIYDELGMDSSNAGGTTVAGLTNINIVDCTHPIAAGLPRGSTTVLTAPGPLVTLATPVASAQIIATLDDGTGRPSVFAIEAGAPLLPARIATAPARRVGIFWEATTFMSANGLKIFDAAVAWAIASPIPTNTPIAITAQPANASVNETVAASFSIGFSGAAPYSIQWRRSNGAGGFTNIPGATCPTFVTGPTVPADNGASFSAVINNGFSSATSSVATLTVVFDRTPPSMVLAFGGGSPPTSFDLTFSEPIDPSVGGEVLSYELASGVSLISATLDADGKTVHFTSDPITNGTVVRISSPITDRAFTPNTLNPGAPGSSIAIITTGGSIRRHLFSNTGGGTAVSDLTNNIRFPNSPDVIDFPTVMETPPGAADNYGVQLVGYVTAPISGNYTFYMSSDDNGVLFLSTDENPANKRVVAFEQQWANSREWTGNAGNAAGRNVAAPQNISTTLFPGGIPLVQGRRYYIEALMKEGIGGDNLGVAWQRPGDPVPPIGSSPIPGLYLTPFNQPASIAAGEPANVAVLEGRSATFSVNISGSPFLSLQWYQNGSVIAGATNSTFATPQLSTNDSGKTYFVVAANSFSSTTSRVATLTVSRDAAGPTIVAVASVSGADIGLCFDEPLNPATAANAANYFVNGGAVSVTNATLRYDGQTVLLGLNGRVTNGFRVAVSNVLDVTGRNVISPGSSATGNVAGLTPIDIGTAGDPLAPGSSFACRDGEFELIGGGSDVWGNADHGHFAYQSITGNFDKRVKIARIDNASASAKGGFMVRESLAAGSRNLSTIVMPPPAFNPLFTDVGRNIYESGTRRTTDGVTDGWGISGGVNGNIPALHPNSWIRFRRIGTIWKTYASSNGVAWAQFGESEQLYPNAVLFMLEAAAVNNDGRTNRVLFQSFSDTILSNISLSITQQPVAASIDANHDVSFRVGATASGVAASEIGYQWQRGNGAGGFTNVNAIGANSATFTFLAALTDNNAQYRVVASLPGTNVTSSAATLTVTNDVTPPRVLSALRNCSAPNQITVVFDGLVDATTAGEVLNYGINNETIAVTSVSVASNRLSAVVTAASAIPDGMFNLLRVEGVRDLANNAMPTTQVLISLAGGRSAVGNQIVFEAENFDANTPATDGHFFAFRNTVAGVGGFSGAGYMQSFPETGSGANLNQPAHTVPGASPRLDYCVNFPSAGTWRVWVRGNDVGGGNSIHIGLDGNSLANENFRIGNTGGATGWGNPAGATSPWQWTRDANDLTTTFAAVVVTNAGSHVFNIWMREDGTLVDKILLTLDTAFTLSPNTIIGPNETPLIDTTPGTRLTITRSGTNVTITSPVPAGVGRLQQATNVSGPWSVVTNANPASYTTPASGGSRFFRLIIP